MIENFKFLSDDNDEIIEEWEGATWMWDGLDFPFQDLSNRRWEIITGEFVGIRDFLSQFPNNYIAVVHSITGNNIRHSSDSDEIGWGFDILTEPITVEYYRFFE